MLDVVFVLIVDSPCLRSIFHTLHYDGIIIKHHNRIIIGHRRHRR
jgi:hypothetical protein